MSSIEFDFESGSDYTATIKVVGVGGGGTNAVNSMVRDIKKSMIYRGIVNRVRNSVDAITRNRA